MINRRAEKLAADQGREGRSTKQANCRRKLDHYKKKEALIMSKTAGSMLSDEENIPDELLAHICLEDAQKQRLPWNLH